MLLTATAISGPYYGSWSGEYIGATEDGFEVEHTFYSEPVRGDNLGDSIQDEVLRGADVYVNFTLIEYGKAAIVESSGAAASSIHWPNGGSGFNGAGNGKVGVIGDVLSDYADSLILTAVAASPAAAIPASITFPGAVLARNFPVRILYASRLRRIPMRMIALPQGASGGASQTVSYNDTIFWYTTT